MSYHSRELGSLLREAGLRLTPQRMMIVSALASTDGHMTAEAIYELVRLQHPQVNLSTVYRTLETLVEIGFVAETDLGGGVHEFELVGAERHHHLICQRCGRATEIGDEFFEPLRAQLLADFGFSSRMDHFAIFGICRDCVAREELRSSTRTSNEA